MTEYINYLNRKLLLYFTISLCVLATACSNNALNKSPELSFEGEAISAQQELAIDPYLLQNYPPVDIDTHESYQQALRLIKQDKLKAAQRLLIKITKNNPDLSAPYLQLAIINRKTKDQELAKKQALKALTINQYNYPAYVFIAELLQEDGLFFEATQQYQTIINLWPGYSEAYYHLARVQDLYLGETELAFSNYQHYLKLHGSDKLVEAWLINLKARM